MAISSPASATPATAPSARAEPHRALRCGATGIGRGMARTDTPLFRRALALVALWCLLWAIVGWLRHGAVPTYDQRAGYREVDAGLRRHKASRRRRPATFTRGHRDAWTWPTARRGSATGFSPPRPHSIAGSVSPTLAWALLPASLLLLAAAFADELRRLLRRPGRH